MNWQQSTTNGPAYCTLGQHFVEAGAQVWRYWVTPLVSTECVCGECAQGVVEQDEQNAMVRSAR